MELDAFITRSGAIGSIHAFAGTEESFAFFLALTVAPLIAALVGSIARWQPFALAPEAHSRAEEGAGGKEALFYLNNLVVFGLLALISYMTLAPALPPWLPFAGRSFPAEAHLAVVAPVTVLYFLILCACLIVRWHGSAGQKLKARVRAALLAGSPLFLLLCLYWATVLLPCAQHASSDSLASLMSPLYRHVLTLSAFFSAALTLGGVLCRSRELFLLSYPAATGSPSPAVLFRQIGALVAHASMAVLLIGLVSSTFYPSDKTFSVTVYHQTGAALTETEPLALDGYRLDYQGMSTTVMANKTDLLNQVTFEVSRTDGTVIGQAAPSLQAMATTRQTHFHAAIMGSPLEDLFVIYKGTIPGSQANDDVMELAIEVRVNHLVSFVWAGFALFTIGCLLSIAGHLIPKKTIAAQKAGADYLITRDAKGFDRSMVPAISPAAWLDLMEGKGLVYDAGAFPKN